MGVDTTAQRMAQTASTIPMIITVVNLATHQGLTSYKFGNHVTPDAKQALRACNITITREITSARTSTSVSPLRTNRFMQMPFIDGSTLERPVDPDHSTAPHHPDAVRQPAEFACGEVGGRTVSQRMMRIGNVEQAVAQ